MGSREDGINGLRALARARAEGATIIAPEKRAEAHALSLAEERDRLAALVAESKGEGEK